MPRRDYKQDAYTGKDSCPTCEGWGTVWHVQRPMKSWKVACPECKGSGKRPTPTALASAMC